MVVYIKNVITKIYIVNIDEVVNFYSQNSFKYGFYPTSNTIEIINFYFLYNPNLPSGIVIHVDYSPREERKIKLLKLII
jgi:hypothetical protein